jgi:hypothetical protein
MNDLFDELITKSNIDKWTVNKKRDTATLIMLDEEGDEFIIQVVDPSSEEFYIIGQAFIVMTMDTMDDIISAVHQYCNNG